MNNLERILSKNRKYEPKVAVIGDVCLDINECGESGISNRSSEHQVFQRGRAYHSLGGAGNVFSNLSHIVDCDLYTVLGFDKPSKLIRSIIRSTPREKSHIISSESYRPVTKIRYFDKADKLVFQTNTPTFQVPVKEIFDLTEKLIANYHKYDYVVIADYNLGLFNEGMPYTLSEFWEDKSNFIVTTRGKSAKYLNIAGLMQNSQEHLNTVSHVDWLAGLVGSKEKNSVQKILQTYNLSYLINTSGVGGMAFTDREGQNFMEEGIPVDNFANSIGAGDTALAWWVIGKVFGFSDKESLAISNLAAAWTTQYKGCVAPITQALIDFERKTDENFKKE